MICDKLDIDVWELIALANRHPRVNILQPGPGVGGHCIAVDPWFIVSKTPDEAKLIRTAREVNESKPEWVIAKVNEKVIEFLRDHPEKSIKDVTIACYGLAFKPDIDDLRESPAVNIVNKLVQQSFKVLAVEPNINKLPDRLSNNFKLSSLNEAENADIHLILVNHKAFKSSLNSNSKYIVDTIGINRCSLLS